MFTQALAAMAAGIGRRSSASARRSSGLADRGRQDHRRRHRHGRVDRPTPMSWRSAAIRRGCCKPVGIRVPVYPVKGYSITVPITDAAGAPESTVMDETYKVAITRLGDRIRVGGTAEIVGLQPAAARSAARDARSCRRPTCSRTAAIWRKAELLVRAAADDAGRPAGHRPRRATPTSISTPATARSAGPWPAARAGCWPTSCPAGSRRSTWRG